MDNQKLLEELKFGVGDGNLHYYLYNWKCPEIKCEKVYLELIGSSICHVTFSVSKGWPSFTVEQDQNIDRYF